MQQSSALKGVAIFRYRKPLITQHMEASGLSAYICAIWHKYRRARPDGEYFLAFGFKILGDTSIGA